MSKAELVPDGCRVVLLSPFEVHFSQTRIRDQFQDSRTLAEAVEGIKVVPYPRIAGAKSGPDSSEAVEANLATEGDSGDDFEDMSSRGKDFSLLDVPFPRIEVTKWRCKLREPDGSAKLDPAGMELYSHEEIWFTFDNRRLCCLQRAAAKEWPREVRCEVVEVPTQLAKGRELRKFDTRTFGYSVLVGRRESGTSRSAAAEQALTSWSWRLAVGLPEELQPEEGIARQQSMRWRRPRQGSRPSSGNGSNYNGQDQAEDEGNPTLEMFRNALLFFLVYISLRLVVSIFRHRYQAATEGSAG